MRENGAAIEIVEKATVRFPDGEGQGVVVKDCLIVTAAHCVNVKATGGGGQSPHHIETIETSDGRRFPVSPVAVEPVQDIAVLGPPSSADLIHEESAYKAFCNSLEPVALETGNGPFDVRIRSHNGRWIDGRAFSDGARINYKAIKKTSTFSNV